MTSDSSLIFSDESLDDRLDAYLRRLRWALDPLPTEDREEILRETRAHFVERMSSSDPETAFQDVVHEFGAPEEYARPFLDNYQLTVAIADGSGTALIPQALRMAGRGVAALLGTGVFLLLYGVAGALLILAVLKLVVPAHVGAWYAPAEGVYGLGFVDASTAATSSELLGYWILPVNVGLALLLYQGTNTLLYRFLKRFVTSA